MEKLSEIIEVSIDVHRIKVMQEYAEDGVYVYGKIGQMYNEHLIRDSKEGVRGEENERE